MKSPERSSITASEQSAKTWYYLYLLLLLFLVACSRGEVAAPTQAVGISPHQLESVACQMLPVHEIQRYEAESAGYANVDGVMDAANYEISICEPSEDELQRAVHASELPIKVSLASANGDWYKVEYRLSVDASQIEVYLNQERVIRDLVTDRFTTGLAEQTFLGSVSVTGLPQKIVVDFSQSRLAASRYFQTRLVISGE